jgi:hypothetical protein
MGYEGSRTDSDGELKTEAADWGTEVIREKEEPEEEETIGLTGEQATRMLAVQMAAQVLSKTAGAAMLGGKKPIPASEIIELADYVLTGDLYEDEDEGWAFDEAGDFRQRQAGLFEKVQTRAAAFAPGFQQMMDLATTMTVVQVPVEELRIGDQIAADGDTVVDEPVLEDGVWHYNVHCPNTPEDAKFALEGQVGTTVTVFNRSVQVPMEELKVGDHVTPDGDAIVAKPVFSADTDTWTITAHCPSGVPESTYAFTGKAGTTIKVFNRS